MGVYCDNGNRPNEGQFTEDDLENEMGEDGFEDSPLKLTREEDGRGNAQFSSPTILIK